MSTQLELGDINVLKEDVKRYLYSIGRTYCKTASIAITEVAKGAIAQFYDDYSPRVYVRTKNLLHNSYAPYYKEHGQRIYGGTRVSSDDMFENYEVSANYVMDAAWHGWHGIKGEDFNSSTNFISPIWTTAPLSMVKSYIEDSKFNDELLSNAIKFAALESYTYLNDFI